MEDGISHTLRVLKYSEVRCALRRKEPLGGGKDNVNIRIVQNGSAVIFTEIQVSVIDKWGDAVDVDHFENRKEANAAAQREMADGALAVVVEKHISRRPAFCFDDGDTYKTLATLGDCRALEAGGWLE